MQSNYRTEYNLFLGVRKHYPVHNEYNTTMSRIHFIKTKPDAKFGIKLSND